jgi:hypothetical protein
LEVDRLSRAGHLRLRMEGRGRYILRPAPHHIGDDTP